MENSKCNSKGSGDGYEYTAPIGSFLSEAAYHGVIDMAGNVWEW
ncbi:SUMF1/EgtB/PvdO family nonheme iron enzyme [bacterium]|nr:SUMF1/EgtB/PvdO family nonheme iron enzyme [bacterium]